MLRRLIVVRLNDRSFEAFQRDGAYDVRIKRIMHLWIG